MCDDGIDDGGLDWEDIAFLCALSEEIAEEKREQERLERDLYQENDIYPDEDF